jgi:hypothetical protein
MGASYQITDDRGHKVSLCEPEPLPSELPREVREMVRKAFSGQPGNILLMLGGTALGMIGANIVFRGFDVINVLGALIGIGFVAAIMIGWSLTRGRTRVREAVARCTRWGICAACGYPLGSAKVERDRCRLCPECGAAWRRADSGTLGPHAG